MSFLNIICVEIPMPSLTKVLGGRGIPVEVYLKRRNLKELTEGHHQEWSLRLDLTQHGKTHQVQT